MSSYPNKGLLAISRTVKRKVFVSYHHASDQAYYNEFSKFFDDSEQVITDNSLDRFVDSDDPEYVMRRIRENYISGTSCTIMLCGPFSHQRKYMDWECKATLDKCHGLIGVRLPTNHVLSGNISSKPLRLQDNIDSGYAIWVQWDKLSNTSLPIFVEQAISRSILLIHNSRPMKIRNG